MPEDKLRETLSRMHRVNQGLRASSEKAESAVSEMTRVMGKLNRARNAEREWLQEESKILKDLVGWKKRSPRDPMTPKRKRLTTSRKTSWKVRSRTSTCELGTPNHIPSGLTDYTILVMRPMGTSQVEEKVLQMPTKEASVSWPQP